MFGVTTRQRDARQVLLVRTGSLSVRRVRRIKIESNFLFMNLDLRNCKQLPH